MLYAVETAVPINAVTLIFVFWKIPISPRIKAATSRIMPHTKIMMASIQPPCPDIKIIERKQSKIGTNESTKE